MKITLIAPGWKKEYKSRRKRSRVFSVPPLGLQNIAAVTPSDVEIDLIDEGIEEVTFDTDTDLVGITATSAGAPRAYEIGDGFQELGVPVVMGGPHVSYMVDEALEHCDSVVVGEGEGSWETLIDDFRRGGKDALSKTYQNRAKPDLTNVPPPRQDMLKKDDYVITNTMHITRGCPHNCSFCSVTDTFGRKIRCRPVEQVVEYVRKYAGKSLKDRTFIFLDDNIMANRRFAKELFRALIPFKILWISQASINSAYDEEMLDLAAQSGCKGLFVGLETVSEGALKEVGKSQNKISFYKEAIKRFHKYGIFIEAGFIFGFDHDQKDVFEKTVRFANRLQLDGVQYTVLTPLPGTAYYYQIERENRFLTKDWTQYDCGNAVTLPTHMTAEEMQAGLHWAYKKTYSLFAILYRSAGALMNRKRIPFFLLLIGFNIGHRITSRKNFKYGWNPNRRRKARPMKPWMRALTEVTDRWKLTAQEALHRETESTDAKKTPAASNGPEMKPANYITAGGSQ